MSAAGGAETADVLIVGCKPATVGPASSTLSAAGYHTTVISSGADSFARIADETPDLVLVEARLDDMPGLEFVGKLRSGPWHTLPLIFLGADSEDVQVVDALRVGADDYLAASSADEELVARVESKLVRPPVPGGSPHHRRQAVSERQLLDDVGRELQRARPGMPVGALAAISVSEFGALRGRLGAQVEHEIASAFVDLVQLDALPLEVFCTTAGAAFLVVLPQTDSKAVQERLRLLSQRVTQTVLHVGAEQVRVTPVMGYAMFDPAQSPSELRDRALLAMEEADSHLDLLPVAYTRALDPIPAPGPTARDRLEKLFNRARSALEVLFTLGLALTIPFIFYALVWVTGFDVAGFVYLVVVALIVAQAALVWLESGMAVRPRQPPANPSVPYPAATAIIAAYLPNEAATILDTLEHFLAQDYPGPLQVILAYNSPKPFPVEESLATLAERHPNLNLLKVERSTSKAQNVNAAIALATGEFVGIFDADHHPVAGSFARAWRWLSDGHDVVQGHCVVRNGAASWVTRMVAVEFETIYAVSHPGRARLNDFGIFGGSNGFWKRDALRMMRMRRSMLTEDIDSSMRALQAGLDIVSDPGLGSTELAPTTLRSLWHQRMRWAQGWTQTARVHLRPILRSDLLSLRQKVGALFLLGWTQAAPWITIQIFPILAFEAWRRGGVVRIDLVVPLFLALSLFTLSVGVAQTVFAYVLGDPSIKGHRRWFWWYGLTALFYTEFKNSIVRVAQLKEVTGDRQWRVTPRPTGPSPGGASVPTSGPVGGA